VERYQDALLAKYFFAMQSNLRKMPEVLIPLTRRSSAMEQLETLARWGALGFLTGLAAVVACKMLFGTIPLSGLLTGDRRDGDAYFSLGRMQLLFFTLVIAANYVRQVAANASLTSLPDVPTGALAWLGGSQLFYLAGKARALWFNPSAPSSE
jgi:hypothetical protein